MTTLYPRAIASTANASIAVAKNGSLKSRTMAPISIVDAPRRLRACGFGRYPKRRDATRTRSRVSAAIGTRVGASLRTRDTVLWETPAARAISRMVVIDRGRAPSVSVTVADDGSLTPSCGSIAIPASVSPRCAQTISFLPASLQGDETPDPGKGPGRGSEMHRQRTPDDLRVALNGDGVEDRADRPFGPKGGPIWSCREGSRALHHRGTVDVGGDARRRRGPHLSSRSQATLTVLWQGSGRRDGSFRPFGASRCQSPVPSPSPSSPSSPSRPVGSSSTIRSSGATAPPP